MADTGAPWNIPFAEPADLVRDWPALSEDVADAVAAGLTAAGNAGIGSNVVQTVKTDTFSASVGGAAFSSNITGLEATITPSSDTSLVLVLVSVTIAHQQGGYASPRLMRDATPIAIAAAEGSRPRLSAANLANTGTNSDNPASVSIVHLDNPGVDTAVTYGVQVYNQESGSQTVFCNRSTRDPNDRLGLRTASSITLIEVAP